jgi:hypothetical protein
MPVSDYRKINHLNGASGSSVDAGSSDFKPRRSDFVPAGSDFSDSSDFGSGFYLAGGGMAKRRKPPRKTARPVFRAIDGESVLPFPRSERRVQQQKAIAARALRAWGVIEKHRDSVPVEVQRAARELLDLLEESQL